MLWSQILIYFKSAFRTTPSFEKVPAQHTLSSICSSRHFWRHILRRTCRFTWRYVWPARARERPWKMESFPGEIPDAFPQAVAWKFSNLAPIFYRLFETCAGAGVCGGIFSENSRAKMDNSNEATRDVSFYYSQLVSPKWPP